MSHIPKINKWTFILITAAYRRFHHSISNKSCDRFIIFQNLITEKEQHFSIETRRNSGFFNFMQIHVLSTAHTAQCLDNQIAMIGITGIIKARHQSLPDFRIVGIRGQRDYSLRIKKQIVVIIQNLAQVFSQTQSVLARANTNLNDALLFSIIIFIAEQLQYPRLNIGIQNILPREWSIFNHVVADIIIRISPWSPYLPIDTPINQRFIDFGSLNGQI